jgi:EAL domain-containing protein (putative c-di-GMP-specific phosphodiesterase class I)
MRTQFMPEDTMGLPWLEHFSAKGGPPEKTLIDKSPFLIGRGESTDLQIDSQGVSREHAAIEREGHPGGTRIRIRDLGSTNGTFVNGQRIKEAELHDGDMVQVADFEFAFCGGKSPRRAAVTQVLADNSREEYEPESEAEPGDTAADIRRAVRSLHETLVSGCVPCRLKPIVALGSGQLAGYQPSDEDVLPAAVETDSLQPPIPGRVTERLRHLRRMRGVEQAAAMPGRFFIFVPIPATLIIGQPAEVAAGRLVALAGMLCELLQDPNRLVLGVPYAAAKEAAAALTPDGRLRELGVALAVSGFAGGDAGTALLAELQPEFVRIAASVVCGTLGKSTNARARKAMFRTVHGGATKVIAAGINTAAERAACLEAGCELGQGALFEEQKRQPPELLKSALRATPASIKLKSGGGPSAAVDAFFLSQTPDALEYS